MLYRSRFNAFSSAFFPSLYGTTCNFCFLLTFSNPRFGSFKSFLSQSVLRYFARFVYFFSLRFSVCKNISTTIFELSPVLFFVLQRSVFSLFELRSLTLPCSDDVNNDTRTFRLVPMALFAQHQFCFALRSAFASVCCSNYHILLFVLDVPVLNTMSFLSLKDIHNFHIEFSSN